MSTGTNTPAKARRLMHSIECSEPTGAKLTVIRNDGTGEVILTPSLSRGGVHGRAVLRLDLRAAHELAQCLAFLPPLPAVPPAPLVQPGQFPKPAAPCARARGKGRAA